MLPGTYRQRWNYVYCHYYLDGNFVNDANSDGKSRRSGGKKYLIICKVCVNDGTNLVWNRGKKTNTLQDGKTKRKS